MLVRPRAPLLWSLALLGACRSAPAAEPASPPAVTELGLAPELAEVGRARLELRDSDGRERSFDWSTASNLVSCRHYAEPERGDYLWIRLAETPAEGGDAGVRLDIDVCRLGAVDAGALARMPAGQHGSHCATEPGFAIWWHERDSAFNSGPVDPDPDATHGEGCQLELEHAGDGLVRGRFACAPLRAADTEGEAGPEASPEPTKRTGRELTLAAGSFTCAVERAG